jgi:branched-chain amino acid transport system ATP-binding protein
MSLLSVRDLTVNFGVVSANLGIDLDVNRGEVVGLIGPNGAGKTTFIDAVTGFVKVATGRVQFGDLDLTDASPARRARAGLSRTFQSLELFEDLTVLENLLVAASQPSWSSVLRDLVAPRRGAALGGDDARWAMHLLGIDGVADRMPGELSHGQRKLVGVARALAMKPHLVLLDEPAAGLDTAETAAMAAQVRSLAAHDIAVLLVDHDMDLVANVCDRVVVLDLGMVIATGTPHEVLVDPAVVAAYLGATSQRGSTNG